PLASGDEAEPPPVSLCARSVDGEAGAGGNSAPDGEGPRATYGVEVGGGADAHGPGRVAAGLLGNGGGPTDLPIRASAATERAAAAVGDRPAIGVLRRAGGGGTTADVRPPAAAAGVGRHAGPAVERVPAVAIRDRPTVRARRRTGCRGTTRAEQGASVGDRRFHAVTTATTDVGRALPAVGLATAVRARAARSHQERTAHREEREQRECDSPCKAHQSRYRRFLLCARLTPRRCGSY